MCVYERERERGRVGMEKKREPDDHVGGGAELELVDSLDPFSEDIVFR